MIALGMEDFDAAGRQGSPVGVTTDRGPDTHGPGSLSVDTGLLRARLAGVVAAHGHTLDTFACRVEPDGSIGWFDLIVVFDGQARPATIGGGPIRSIEDAAGIVADALTRGPGGLHA